MDANKKNLYTYIHTYIHTGRKKERGKRLVVEICALQIKTLILSGLAWGLRDWHWHLRAISGMVLIGAVILVLVPESPRYEKSASRRRDWRSASYRVFP